jgi:hypothetical protein
VKKLLSIFLLLVYSTASSGTVMSAHFCMGELAAITIGEKQEKACGYCGMEDAGCCHDLSKVVKLDNSQLQKTPTVTFVQFILLPVQVQYQTPSNLSLLKLPQKSLISSGKYIGGPPLYLRNSVFRI